MSSRTEITDDQIAACREILLTAIETGKEKKVSQKEALRKMLSALIAAHNAGMNFETMQALLVKGGMSITTYSLRNYYFALRNELQISIAEKAHAKRLAAAKASIESKLIVREAHKVGQTSKAEASKPAAPAPQYANPRNNTEHGQVSGSVIQQNAAENTISTHREPQLSEGEAEAMTVEQIEKISEEKEKNKYYEHPLFAEMLIVKENRVYLESGKPFIGTLLSTQIYLLRKNGRIFPPPPPSRTSKDFVKMPRVL